VFEPGPSPTDQPGKNNAGTPLALIEGIIPFPPALGLRSRSYLAELLSAREVSRVAAVSRPGGLSALVRFDIPRYTGGGERIGHLPFGFDCQEKRVANGAERDAICMMQEQRINGRSPREIAGEPNSMLLPTQQGGM
jgi:hypothetical protein